MGGNGESFRLDLRALDLDVQMRWASLGHNPEATTNDWTDAQRIAEFERLVALYRVERAPENPGAPRAPWPHQDRAPEAPAENQGGWNWNIQLPNFLQPLAVDWEFLNQLDTVAKAGLAWGFNDQWNADAEAVRPKIGDGWFNAAWYTGAAVTTVFGVVAAVGAVGCAAAIIQAAPAGVGVPIVVSAVTFVTSTVTLALNFAQNNPQLVANALNNIPGVQNMLPNMGGFNQPAVNNPALGNAIQAQAIQSNDVTTYQDFVNRSRVGDGLEGHELWQHANLRANGLADERLSTAASQNNPVIALDRAMHVRVNAAQRELDVAGMTPLENIRANAAILRRLNAAPENVIQEAEAAAIRHAGGLGF